MYLLVLLLVNALRAMVKTLLLTLKVLRVVTVIFMWVVGVVLAF